MGKIGISSTVTEKYLKALNLQAAYGVSSSNCPKFAKHGLGYSHAMHALPS